LKGEVKKGRNIKEQPREFCAAAIDGQITTKKRNWGWEKNKQGFTQPSAKEKKKLYQRTDPQIAGKEGRRS